MKTKKLLILSFVLPLILNIALAQSPILEADRINPVVGDQFTLKYVSHITSPGNAGPNQVWDFSSMISDSSFTYTIIPVSSTPYASYFKNATIAGIQNNSYGYDYYKTDSTAWENCGYADSTCIGKYSDGVFLKFPFTYLESITNYTTDSDCSGNSTDTIIAMADGYDTLKTPAGTFTNVLRIYYPNMDFTPFQYLWLSNGIHFPLLVLSPRIFEHTNQYGDSLIIDTIGYYGYYLANYSTGIIEQANKEKLYDIYPNPAINNITIHTSSFHNEAVTVSIMNVLGQPFDCAQGAVVLEAERSRSLVINVSSLSAGMYFLQLKGESGSVVRRFVKE